MDNIEEAKIGGLGIFKVNADQLIPLPAAIIGVGVSTLHETYAVITYKMHLSCIEQWPSQTHFDKYNESSLILPEKLSASQLDKTHKSKCSHVVCIPSHPKYPLQNGEF